MVDHLSVYNLEIKLYYKYLCIGKDSVYRLGTIHGQAATGGLGMYPLQIRGDCCNSFEIYYM